MFKKIINWWNKPWTNGTYIKWSLSAVLISAVYSICWMFAIGVFKFPRKK